MQKGEVAVVYEVYRVIHNVDRSKISMLIVSTSLPIYSAAVLNQAVTCTMASSRCPFCS